VTPKNCSIGGDAGATLALALANHFVADPSKRSMTKGCVAMVPAVLHWDHVPPEYKSMYKSMDDNVGVSIIDKESMKIFLDAVGVDPKDANTLAALNKGNHKDFPPTYIVTCEADPLRDDGIIMEGCLKKAGVPVKRDNYADLPHYFWIFPSVTEGKEFVGNPIGGCKWVVEQM
jgi:versiconal hemiacetal acetate esterase